MTAVRVDPDGIEVDVASPAISLGVVLLTTAAIAVAAVLLAAGSAVSALLAGTGLLVVGALFLPSRWGTLRIEPRRLVVVLPGHRGPRSLSYADLVGIGRNPPDVDARPMVLVSWRDPTAATPRVIRCEVADDAAADWLVHLLRTRAIEARGQDGRGPGEIPAALRRMVVQDD
jgi:hypothetical protein